MILINLKLFTLVLLLGALGLAQPLPELNGVLATDSSQLDARAINEAAAPLLDAGQQVVVVFIEANVGDSLSDAEAYFARALESYGVSTGDANDSNLFALYIGTDPRAVYRAYGAELEPVFFTPQGGTTFDAALQDAVVVPRLLAGEFSEAITSALGYVAVQLENQTGVSVPPVVGDASVSTETQSGPSVTEPTPAEPTPAGRPGLFNLPFLLVLAALALFLLRRRKRASSAGTSTANDKTRSSKPVEANAAAELQQLQNDLSGALIDLSGSEPTAGDVHLPDDPNEQADMVLLGDLLAEERPEEVADLQAAYRRNVTALKEVSARFETLRAAGVRDDAPDAAALAAEYQTLVEKTNEIKAFSSSLSAKFDEVQREIADLPARLDALENSLESSKAAYEDVRSPGWAESAQVFEPLAKDVAQARALAQKQPLSALKQLSLTAQNLATVQDASARLAEVEKRLLGFRMSLDAQRQQGYKLADRDKLLEEAQYNLDVALGLLQQREYKVLDAQVDEVAELSETLVEGTKTLLALREKNELRLDELKREGEAIEAVIEAAALAFDAVDDYAPSSWRDIRGNGTEAQKAAARAFALWEQASELNRMDGAQDFEGARAAIEAGFAELEQVRKLTAAISERLKHLRAAQASAREQLALVEEDLAARSRLLNDPEVDREVSEQPERLLREAEAEITRAKTALAEAQPDWLLVVKAVQRADSLCDEALDTLRSEQAAMQHRRVRRASEETEATAALERVMQYARVHSSDMSASTLTTLRAAQAHFREGEQASASSAQLADEALVEALEAAIMAFDQAEQRAEEAFARAEQDFKEMEGLRARAAAATASVHASFDNLNRFAARAESSSSAQRTLYGLQSSLPQYTSDADRDTLTEVLRRADSLEKEIQNVQVELRQQLKQRETALRRERERRLDVERRRRAADWGRNSSSWGTWNQPAVVLPAPGRNRSRASRSRPVQRRIPTASRSAPVKLPRRSTPAVHSP